MKKTVLIELDKARNMRIGTNQIAILQDMGINLTRETELGIRELRAFLFVALSWEDKNLTLEKVGDMMDDAFCDENKGINYIQNKIEKCIDNFIPTFEPGKI